MAVRQAYCKGCSKSCCKGPGKRSNKGANKACREAGNTTRESKESRAMATVHITVAMQATDSAYAAALGRAATRSYQALIFLLAAFNGWPT